MKLEEAIIYVLTNENRGLSTEQIAFVINHYELHQRKDRNPVTSRQIYAAVCRNPNVFIKEGGIIHLMM